MVSRNAGRFAATVLLSLDLMGAVFAVSSFLHSAALVDREFWLAASLVLLMVFFWLFFTVIDSLVVLAVPPQRTASGTSPAR